MKPVSLFFMAHQDDEYGVFHQIKLEIAAGRQVRCIYVTDGAATADPDLRDSESRTVLQKLGVAGNDILFVGRQLSIGDGHLHNHVRLLANWLDKFLGEQGEIVSCTVPAWEGGHPDHDLLHAIVVKLLDARGKSTIIWQFPLYNARNCVGKLFRTMSPIPENGPVQRQSIPLGDRFEYVTLCLSYPSQWRSWLGLFPFVSSHYLMYGEQYLQPVSLKRLEERPHPGPLYYERRGFLDYPTVRTCLEHLNNHLASQTKIL